jgi:hypothetical protein
MPASDEPKNSSQIRHEDEPEKGDAMRASDESKKADAMRASGEPKNTGEMPGSDTSVERDGGNDEPASDVSKDELTYYKDTKPIIDAKCAICHMPGGIAPMAFTTYAEVRPFTTLMALDVEGGVMPPWLPSDPSGKFIGDVHSYAGRGASLSTLQNYEIFWVDMHMHALGSAGRIGLVRANGDLEELVNIPVWDFGWQETFMLRKPVTLFPNDNLYVECHFDNTPEAMC